MTRDWLLNQLPMGMLDDDFFVRFVSIFQDMADTYIDQVDGLVHAFDPAVAPTDMVQALGAWIGVDFVDPSLPDEVQRRIVRDYGQLLQWRGTRRGMTLLLELLTDGPVQLIDRGAVFLAGQGGDTRRHVAIQVTSSGWVTEDDLVRIVAAELPASVSYELYLGDRRLWPDAVRPAVTSGHGRLREVS